MNRPPGVLVTGGCGFLGSAVTRHLLQRGKSVTVLDDLSTGVRANLPQHPALSFIRGSIESRPDVRRALSGNRHVIHLAAEAYVPDSFDRPADYERVNVEGSRSLFSECTSVGVERVVVASTAEVYGGAHETPISENCPPHPVSPYAETKLEMEGLVLEMLDGGDISVVVVRLFNAFGPRATRPYVIPEIIRQCVHEPEIKLGNINAKRDFCPVSDTAAGLVDALLEKEMGGEVINLGSGSARRISDVVSDIQRIVGREPPLVIDPARVRERDIPMLVANPGKARGMLGWGPTTSFEDALRQTIDWYASSGNRWPYELAGR